MKELAADVAKITPPATVGGIGAVWSLQEWVWAATLVYTILVIFDKFYPGALAKAGRCVWSKIKRMLNG